MKKILTGLAIIVSFSLNAQQTAVNVSIADAPVVQTKSGNVKGATDNDVTSFKGIPYAAPPVGEFRWRPPQPVKSWEGEFDATEYGANCAQAGWGAAPGTISEGSSEDCLYLNLWKPAGSKAW